MSIQTMRDNSDGVVAKVIVGLIVVVFALFGMGSITTFLAPTPKVATVNGEDVTQQQMEVQVERSRRVMLSQNPDPSAINEDQLRSDVLENLINRALLTTAADDLGLAYGNLRLDAEIVNTPVFQVDGLYNPDQFQLVLNSAGFTPTGYRNEMRKDKLLAQLGNAVQSTAFMTEREAKRATSLSQQTRDVAYLRVVVDALKSDVVVDKAEVERYYESNPGLFMTDEMADIGYIEIKRGDLLQKIEVDDQALMDFFEDTSAIYAEPERRRLAHILIEISDAKLEDVAKAEVDGIYQQIIDGADFADLAKEFSNDPGSAEIGGDLGFNDPGTFVDEFESVGYALSLNQMSKPVLTEFGYHIIRLIDLEAAKEPIFAEVRDRVEAEFREVGAEEMFVDLSARLSEISFEATDLQEPAEELELELKATGLIKRVGEEGIAANPAFINAAFASDVLLDGNNSTLIEITPNHHVVVRINEHQPSELKSLETVNAEVTETLVREKATALATEQAKAMVAMLEDGSITRFVADQFGLKWTVVSEANRNDRGVDPEINREAFSLARPTDGNKSVGFVSLANGDTAVVSVTNVKNKLPTEIDTSNLSSLARVLATREGAADYQELRDYLAATGNISKQ
ncbi:MAG: peptidyl-prolyl cis-trans isomerase D [Candidatus Azotimanducaceae bacterium]|jgi:peptidyl-prolyl cis-trans isomerase D